jgi:tetratricopeptide (TPR) repeat protein
MSKRLAYLEKVTSEGKADSFAWYALGLEYAGLDRVDDALGAFKSLREKDPHYVPMYLMCGTILQKHGRADEAREWLESGQVVAKEAGDSKAFGEIRDALAKL